LKSASAAQFSCLGLWVNVGRQVRAVLNSALRRSRIHSGVWRRKERLANFDEP
jgi:hypothetical protein